MINFERFELENGLKVLVYEDDTTPMAAVNVLYNVGARDEEEEKTGFAHLFEHLMFGGSENIPDFDAPLQMAGGESNAFTNNDLTNYYDTLPAHNLETAFWLESDRMKQLDFNPNSLEVQRKVVIEEFKEHYINKPYGEVWHKLSELAFKVHPYKWPTIGKNLKHIEDANLEDVEDFFNRFYSPDNAIVVVGGGVKLNEVKELSKKWFGDIQPYGFKKTPLNREPEQTEFRALDLQADVPLDALYMAFHMGDRKSDSYHAADLLSDVLCSGQSSRLHQSLVKDKEVFNNINAYITGTMDDGLLVIEGKIRESKTMQDAEDAVMVELDQLLSKGLREGELEKVKNKVEAQIIFSETDVLNKVINLAFYELLGDASITNNEIDTYLSVEEDEMMATARDIFKLSNCSTLRYHSERKN